MIVILSGEADEVALGGLVAAVGEGMGTYAGMGAAEGDFDVAAARGGRDGGIGGRGGDLRFNYKF